MRSLILACAIGSMVLAACARTYETAPGISAQIEVEQGNQTVLRRDDASSAEANSLSAGATDQHQETGAPDMAAQAAPAAQREQSVARDTDGSRKEFVARVLGDTEDVWSAVFKAMGNPPYPMPTVVLFSFGTSSACGLVRAEVGPIYCPADSQIYVDPDFLSELSRRTTPSATSHKRIYSPVRSGITYKTRSARCRSSSAPCRRWTTHGASSYKCAESYRRTAIRVSGLFMSSSAID